MEEFLPLIDAYIKGELTGSELENFEAKMASSTELQEEVQFYRQTAFALENQEKIKAFEALIPQLGADLSGKKEDGKTLSLWRPWMGAVAAVLLLLIMIPVLMNLFSNQKNNNIDIYAENYAPLSSEFWEAHQNPNVSQTDRDLKNQEFWEKAIFYYQQEEYTKVIPLLDSLITNGYRENDAEFLIGLSILATEEMTDEDFEEVKTILKGYLNKEGYAEEAAWYLALACIKKGKNQEAITWLNLLRESEIYGDKVEKIIQYYRRKI